MLNVNTITEEEVNQILQLYQEIIGGSADMLSAKSVLEDIETGNAFYDGYRIGSRWDEHSKLTFRKDPDGNLTAGFNSNFDLESRSEDNPSYQEAVKAGQKFRESINALS